VSSIFCFVIGILPAGWPGTLMRHKIEVREKTNSQMGDRDPKIFGDSALMTQSSAIKAQPAIE